MKPENIFLIICFGVFFILLAIYIFLAQDKGEIERAPAVYYVKRADIRPEYDKYNIY